MGNLGKTKIADTFISLGQEAQKVTENLMLILIINYLLPRLFSMVYLLFTAEIVKEILEMRRQE